MPTDKELLEQFNDTMGNYTDRVKALEEQVRKNTAAAGKLNTGGAGFGSPFEQEVAKKLKDSIPLLENLKSNKAGFSLEFENKDTTLGGIIGTYPSTDMSNTATPRLFEALHIRQLFPGGRTEANVFRYPVDTGGTGGPGTVLEGGLKPLTSPEISILDAPTRKIATHFKVTEEALMDTSWMYSLLTLIGTESVAALEDIQILYGDGIAPNLSGLKLMGTAFAAGTSIVAAPNNLDALSAAKKQMRNAKVPGTIYAIVNPTDFFNLVSTKDQADNYTMRAPSLAPIQGSVTSDGITILEHTAVTEGDFFVVSPRAAQVIDRLTTSVRFLQDVNDSIHNVYTIICERRLALPVFYPKAIVHGTFAAAITDLTS